MGRRWLSAWFVGIPILAVLAPPAPGYAAAPQPTVTTYTAMTGVPNHVPAGGTLSFTMTFVEQSQNRLYLDGLVFEVWNRCLCLPDDVEGSTATFLDPSTGTWRTTLPASGDSYGLFFQQLLLLAPGQTISVPVRLSVGHFRSGSYTLADNGTTVGGALDGQGNYIPFTWNHNEAGNQYFIIGTGTAPGTSPPRTPPARQPPIPAAQRPQPSPTLPAPSASTNDTPGPPPSTAAPASATPSTTAPADLAQTQRPSAGSAISSWWLLPLLLLGAAIGTYAVRRRHEVRTTTPAPGTDDIPN